MRSTSKFFLTIAGFAVFFNASAVFAQDSQERPTLNKDKPQQQNQQQGSATPSQETPSAAPVLSEEDTAMKTLQAMPDASTANLQLKLQAAEGMLQKYPQSRYRSTLYAFLTVGYIQVGQADRAIEFGDKEI